MIKHLIFDFDGVIVDSEILAAEAFAKVLLDMKISSTYSTEFIAEKFAGNKMVKVASEICEAHNIEDKNTYLKKTMEFVNHSYNTKLKAVKGIEKLLSLNIFDFYICSNSGKQRILKGLQNVGLDSFFNNDRIYTFEMVKNPKPSPDIFLKTIEDNNLDKKEVLVLEDSVPGVQAASAAGLKVVGVTVASHWKDRSTKILIESGSIRILKSYFEFKNLLKTIQN